MRSFRFCLILLVGAFCLSLDAVQAQSRTGRAKSAGESQSQAQQKASSTSRTSSPPKVNQAKPTRSFKKSTTKPSSSSKKPPSIKSAPKSSFKSGTSGGSKTNGTYSPSFTNIIIKGNSGTTTTKTPSSSSYNSSRTKVKTPHMGRSTSSYRTSGSKMKQAPTPTRPTSADGERPDFRYEPRLPEVRQEDRAGTDRIEDAPAGLTRIERARLVAENEEDENNTTERRRRLLNEPVEDPIQGENGDEQDPDPGDEGDDNDDDVVIVYCFHCGCAWCDCLWCHYWSPMYWCYYGFAPSYWSSYWSDDWNDLFTVYHGYYDFQTTFPSIYSSPAMILDTDSEVIKLLDDGAEYFRAGNYLEALHCFRLATLADLNCAVSKFAYAQALFALGIYDYAAYEIRLGIYLLPDWLHLGGDLKLMYGIEADFDEQLAALTAHLKLHPNDTDALLVLGYVSFFSGDLYLAEKVFDKLLTSPAGDTAHVAGIFSETIGEIKAELVKQGNNNVVAPTDDTTIDELLRK